MTKDTTHRSSEYILPSFEELNAEPDNDPPGDGDEDGEDEDDEGAEKKGGKWNFLSSSSSSSSSSSEEIKIGQEFPLLLDEFLDRCRERSSKENVCYLTGDERLNEHPWLASHHVVLIREHNRVARRLSDMHPHWDDERLFQETRRIVTAIFQSITYRDYLPRIVGKRILERIDLVVGAKGSGGGGSYNASVNPSSMSVFSTAAFRYLHTLIEGQIQIQGEGRCPIKTYDLSDIQYYATLLEKPEFLTSAFRGMTNQPAQSADTFVTKEVTNKLSKIKKPFGQDLVSIDIQRGRDHGLPSYNDMREMCGLSRAKDFHHFQDVMSEKSIMQLKSLYRSANDVDLIVGGSLEDHCVDGDHSSLVGPTFGCIIAEQFFRWRSGDRYFFDHAEGPGKFTKAQLKAIMKVTLSSLLCENLEDLEYMQADAFSIISKRFLISA
ncbi:peroxidase-like [Hetaerina americana]|uniref:peroxidase-like n=1 Tax=Hetaerina americana TaxID=62018 RepID=UPI003A7F5E9A